MIDDVDVSSVHFIGFHSTPGCRKKVVEEVERRFWAERDGLSERMMMMMVMVMMVMVTMMTMMMMMRIEEYCLHLKTSHIIRGLDFIAVNSFY